MENKLGKTDGEKISISVEVVNFLSTKNCTIDDAKEILDRVKWTIEHTSTVQRFDWKPNRENEKD